MSVDHNLFDIPCISNPSLQYYDCTWLNISSNYLSSKTQLPIPTGNSLPKILHSQLFCLKSTVCLYSYTLQITQIQTNFAEVREEMSELVE